MALRFLKSTYLEKRLKGISDIKSMIERIESSQYYRKMQMDPRMNVKMVGDFDLLNYRQ